MTRVAVKRWIIPLAVWIPLAAFFGWIYLQPPEPAPSSVATVEPVRRYREPSAKSPMPIPSIKRPKTVPAAEANLRDDEEVIGVAVGGKFRAYRIDAMMDPWQHIVNDLIERVPVTVTYCDLLDCVGAFTSDRLGEALNIQNAGVNGEMMLSSNGIVFWQSSGLRVGPEHKDEPVFQQLPIERMKWKYWRESHPSTDVFVGGKK